MKKTHIAIVGQITPLTSVEASSQFILERYFEKVTKKFIRLIRHFLGKPSIYDET